MRGQGATTCGRGSSPLSAELVAAPGAAPADAAALSGWASAVICWRVILSIAAITRASSRARPDQYTRTLGAFFACDFVLPVAGSPLAAVSWRMRIDRLGEHEGDRLRAVRLAALGDAPDAFGGTLADAAARPREQWRQQIVELATFVAVLDGRDVGMVRAAPHPTEPGTGELLSLWVGPDVRGRGVGEALVDVVVAWARDEGLRRVVLEVGDHNTAAIALYARKGFTPTGVTGSLPPPRTHVREHQRALEL